MAKEDGKTDQTETFTAEQVQKQVSDALANAGRGAKSLEDREAAIKAREEALEGEITDALAEAQTELEELREIVRTSSDAIELMQARRELKDKETALTARERDLKKDQLGHKGEVESAAAIHQQNMITTIATKYGIQPEELQGLNLETEAQIEAVASRIAQGRSKAPSAGGGEGEEGEFEPDSAQGATGGGVETLTPESVERMSTASVEKALRKAEPEY